MSEMKHLKQIQHELMCCTGCGYCKKSCPTFDILSTEADSGRGKVFISYGMLSGEIKEDSSVIEALQNCPLCGRCEKDCPSLVRISDIIHAARRDTDDILPAHQTILDNMTSHGNPFGVGKKKAYAGGGAAAGATETVNVAYFSGCMENYLEHGLKKAVISIFGKIGMKVAVVDKECCGNPVDIIGRENHQMKKLGKELDDNGIKKIIFSCPSCMQSFLPFKEKFKLVHISEFLEGMDLNMKNSGMKLIYHDSSVLGRKLGIYDAPRKLLEKAGGFVEFDENKELSQCCGSDIAFREAFSGTAGKMAERIAEEAKEKNTTIVTASPHCYHHLKKYGDVIDLVELVDRCLQ